MKPQTKAEKEIAVISERITRRWDNLTHAGSRQVRWVQEKAAPGMWAWLPYKNRIKPGEANVWCCDCGGKFGHDGKGKPVCPHCGSRLYPPRSTEGHRRVHSYDYIVRAEVHDGWQLLRYFIVRTKSEVGKKVEYSLPTEIVRRWVKPGQRTVIESIGMVGLGGMYREVPWNFNAELSFKREGSGGYYSGGTSYRVDTTKLVRGAKWAEWLTRDGFKGLQTCREVKCELYDAMDLFKSPHLVTLYKANHVKLVSYFLGNARKDINKYWPSIKIALRRGYEIRDINLWLDHIDYLIELGLDIRSPKYVTPYNLAYEHERLGVRYRNLMAKREAARKRAEAKRYETAYAKLRGGFLGLSFSDGRIVIFVFPSVAYIAEEGAALHHCVYDMKYFQRPESLLMTARRADNGDRLETIELSLKDFSVLQSRGQQNKPSPEHDHILALINNNIPAIRKVARSNQQNAKQYETRKDCRADRTNAQRAGALFQEREEPADALRGEAPRGPRPEGNNQGEGRQPDALYAGSAGG